MEATLCFRVSQTLLRKPCSLLALHGTNTTIVGRSSCDFGRLPRIPACPPITITSLHQVLCSQAPPSESGNHGQAADGRNKHSAVAVGVAAVAFASVLGVVCTRRAMRAGAASRLGWISHPGSHPVQLQQPAPASPRQAAQKGHMQHSSLDMLSEMFQWLDSAKLKLKEHPPAMKMSDKGDSTALYEEWKNKGVGPHEKYELGLSLSEILISRGEFKLAKDVCEYLKRIPPPPSDGRVALRMFIINVSTQIESFLSGIQTEKLENVLNITKDSWNNYLKRYKPTDFPFSAPDHE